MRIQSLSYRVDEELVVTIREERSFGDFLPTIVFTGVTEIGYQPKRMCQHLYSIQIPEHWGILHPSAVIQRVRDDILKSKMRPELRSACVKLLHQASGDSSIDLGKFHLPGTERSLPTIRVEPGSIIKTDLQNYHEALVEQQLKASPFPWGVYTDVPYGEPNLIIRENKRKLERKEVFCTVCDQLVWDDEVSEITIEEEKIDGVCKNCRTTLGPPPKKGWWPFRKRS